jgi:two-component system OmpR family sensor kinase
MRGKWLQILYLLPAVLGAAAALVLSSGWLPDPRLIFALGGDAAGLALAAGLTLTALLVLLALLAGRRERRHRRQLAAARSAAAEERRHFLQRLDHEMKNPLMAIRGGLAGIGPERSPEEKKALAVVTAQVEQLSGLVGDLRKLASLESSPLERAGVDMAALLREVVEVARDGLDGLPAAGHGRPLDLNLQETPWALPAVYGDRELLLRAVYNVVDNACKFSPPGTPVEIWALRERSGLRIQVIDQGQGVSQEDLPHLGQELYRGKTARSIPGTGLGLAMARAIARRHGGDLTVDSVLGEGTVVTIHLPAARSP